MSIDGKNDQEFSRFAAYNSIHKDKQNSIFPGQSYVNNSYIAKLVTLKKGKVGLKQFTNDSYKTNKKNTVNVKKRPRNIKLNEKVNSQNTSSDRNMSSNVIQSRPKNNQDECNQKMDNQKMKYKLHQKINSMHMSQDSNRTLLRKPSGEPRFRTMDSRNYKISSSRPSDKKEEKSKFMYTNRTNTMKGTNSYMQGFRDYLSNNKIQSDQKNEQSSSRMQQSQDVMLREQSYHHQTKISKKDYQKPYCFTSRNKLLLSVKSIDIEKSRNSAKNRTCICDQVEAKNEQQFDFDNQCLVHHDGNQDELDKSYFLNLYKSKLCDLQSSKQSRDVLVSPETHSNRNKNEGGLIKHLDKQRSYNILEARIKNNLTSDIKEQNSYIKNEVIVNNLPTNNVRDVNQYHKTENNMIRKHRRLNIQSPNNEDSGKNRDFCKTFNTPLGTNPIYKTEKNKKNSVLYDCKSLSGSSSSKNYKLNILREAQKKNELKQNCQNPECNCTIKVDNQICSNCNTLNSSRHKNKKPNQKFIKITEGDFEGNTKNSFLFDDIAHYKSFDEERTPFLERNETQPSTSRDCKRVDFYDLDKKSFALLDKNSLFVRCKYNKIIMNPHNFNNLPAERPFASNNVKKRSMQESNFSKANSKAETVEKNSRRKSKRNYSVNKSIEKLSQECEELQESTNENPWILTKNVTKNLKSKKYESSVEKYLNSPLEFLQMDIDKNVIKNHRNLSESVNKKNRTYSKERLYKGEYENSQNDDEKQQDIYIDSIDIYKDGNEETKKKSKKAQFENNVVPWEGLESQEMEFDAYCDV